MFDENTRIRDTYHSTSTNECDQVNKYMHTITNYTIDVYTLYEYTSCIASAGQKTRGSSMGSRMARGVRFSLDSRVQPFLRKE